MQIDTTKGAPVPGTPTFSQPFTHRGFAFRLKYWFTLALTVFLFSGCDLPQDLVDKNPSIVTIEGCEFYFVRNGYQGFMAKKDCTCIPNNEGGSDE